MEGLYMDPVLPNETTKVSLNGITYLGNKINYEFDSENTIVKVTSQFKDNEELMLLYQGKTFELKAGVACKIGSGNLWLKPLKKDSVP